ncbi:MAG TPA: UDP-N-acetylmuramate--L-alanine ligase [Patescibacteria group bacterium]|nr:UDP-N-acetylmuramate--L-alanine ligase [Patescibacteria group bacterium]
MNSVKNRDITSLSNLHSLYFVGIKGIAMASLAVWAKEKGCQVIGSDVGDEFPSDIVLHDKGIQVLKGFDAHNISSHIKPDLIIYTGAHGGRDNPEVVEGRKLGIPTLPHGKALGLAMSGKRQISVAGSHGKTTTTAIIATILISAGVDPSYAIGCGKVRGLGPPGHFGRGDYFIAEADEYVTDPTHDPTPRFLWQTPEILVVTNVDYDHPDAYSSLTAVQRAFQKLLQRQIGRKICIVNIDDPASHGLLKKSGNSTIITYGSSDKARYQAKHISFERGKTTFEIYRDKGGIGIFTIYVPGVHNVLNALAAAVASHEAGLSWEQVRLGLSRFRGAKRRFEEIGQAHGVTFFDDYAHHPKEIAATLAAVRSWYPKDRVIAVFQPHTYSRTKSLLSEFGLAFKDADIVVTTDIYGSARETETLGMTGEVFANEVKKHKNVVCYAQNSEAVYAVLASMIKKDDIVIFMGAGNIYLWGKEIYKSIT